MGMKNKIKDNVSYWQYLRENFGTKDALKLIALNAGATVVTTMYEASRVQSGELNAYVRPDGSKDFVINTATGQINVPDNIPGLEGSLGETVHLIDGNLNLADSSVVNLGGLTVPSDVFIHLGVSALATTALYLGVKAYNWAKSMRDKKTDRDAEEQKMPSGLEEQISSVVES